MVIQHMLTNFGPESRVSDLESRHLLDSVEVSLQFLLPEAWDFEIPQQNHHHIKHK